MSQTILIHKDSWRQRLERALSDPEIIYLVGAQNWCTCAVGERLGFPVLDTPDYMRLMCEIGMHHDLYMDGHRFNDAISDGNFGLAMRIYDGIHSDRYDKDFAELKAFVATLGGAK